MTKKSGATLGLAALGIYILGGLASFSGLGLIFLMKGKDLWGWGDGRTIGYLLLCSGICFSMIGVILMRLFRNRGIA